MAVDRVSGARVERKDALGCREKWTQSRDRRSRWKWADRSLRTDGQQRRGSISIGTGACWRLRGGWLGVLWEFLAAEPGSQTTEPGGINHLMGSR